jgi:hypothetical protein
MSTSRYEKLYLTRSCFHRLFADGQAPQLGEINKVMFGIVDCAHDGVQGDVGSYTAGKAGARSGVLNGLIA